MEEPDQLGGPHANPSEGDEAGGEALANWRQSGKCGACAHFAVDFGDAPVFHGHCKMYPRVGARESSAYACGEYRALAGFEDLTRSTTPKVVVRPLDATGRLSIPSGGPLQRGVRRVPAPAGGGAKILRRRGDEPPRSLTSGRVDVVHQAMETAFGGGGGQVDRETLVGALVDVIENFLGIEDVEIGSRWNGGTFVLQPADPELKAYELPVEAFFHKVVMVRDRLRVLEQKINSHPALTDADKVDMQQYISRCYGSLTSFNVLFKRREDRFSSKDG